MDEKVGMAREMCDGCKKRATMTDHPLGSKLCEPCFRALCYYVHAGVHLTGDDVEAIRMQGMPKFIAMKRLVMDASDFIESKGNRGVANIYRGLANDLCS